MNELRDFDNELNYYLFFKLNNNKKFVPLSFEEDNEFLQYIFKYTILNSFKQLGDQHEMHVAVCVFPIPSLLLDKMMVDKSNNDYKFYVYEIHKMTDIIGYLSYLKLPKSYIDLVLGYSPKENYEVLVYEHVNCHGLERIKTFKNKEYDGKFRTKDATDIYVKALIDTLYNSEGIVYISFEEVLNHIRYKFEKRDSEGNKIGSYSIFIIEPSQ